LTFNLLAALQCFGVGGITSAAPGNSKRVKLLFKHKANSSSRGTEKGSRVRRGISHPNHLHVYSRGCSKVLRQGRTQPLGRHRNSYIFSTPLRLHSQTIHSSRTGTIVKLGPPILSATTTHNSTSPLIPESFVRTCNPQSARHLTRYQRANLASTAGRERAKATKKGPAPP
jgi:hypothetical protein